MRGHGTITAFVVGGQFGTLGGLGTGGIARWDGAAWSAMGGGADSSVEALTVLSNGDPDMLEAAKPHHGIPFDAVIAVAQAGSFKPHVATYTKAAEIMGVAMDEALFVANHAFDCIGAKAAGMHTAFIDRRKRPFGGTPHQPDLRVDDMKSLADLMV